jgi:hypothetical protein
MRQRFIGKLRRDGYDPRDIIAGKAAQIFAG